LTKLALVLTLMVGCTSISFVGAKLYRLYDFAQSVTGKALMSARDIQS